MRQKLKFAAAATNGRFGAGSGPAGFGYRYADSCRSASDPIVAIHRAFVNLRKLPFIDLSMGGSFGAKRGLDVYMHRHHTYDFSLNCKKRAKC